MNKKITDTSRAKVIAKVKKRLASRLATANYLRHNADVAKEAGESGAEFSVKHLLEHGLTESRPGILYRGGSERGVFRGADETRKDVVVEARSIVVYGARRDRHPRGARYISHLANALECSGRRATMVDTPAALQSAVDAAAEPFDLLFEFDLNAFDYAGAGAGDENSLTALLDVISSGLGKSIRNAFALCPVDGARRNGQTVHGLSRLTSAGVLPIALSSYHGRLYGFPTVDRGVPLFSELGIEVDAPRMPDFVAWDEGRHKPVAGLVFGASDVNEVKFLLGLCSLRGYDAVLQFDDLSDVAADEFKAEMIKLRMKGAIYRNRSDELDTAERFKNVDFFAFVSDEGVKCSALQIVWFLANFDRPIVCIGGLNFMDLAEYVVISCMHHFGELLVELKDAAFYQQCARNVSRMKADLPLSGVYVKILEASRRYSVPPPRGRAPSIHDLVIGTDEEFEVNFASLIRSVLSKIEPTKSRMIVEALRGNEVFSSSGPTKAGGGVPERLEKLRLFFMVATAHGQPQKIDLDPFQPLDPLRRDYDFRDFRRASSFTFAYSVFVAVMKVWPDRGIVLDLLESRIAAGTDKAGFIDFVMGLPEAGEYGVVFFNIEDGHALDEFDGIRPDLASLYSGGLLNAPIHVWDLQHPISPVETLSVAKRLERKLNATQRTRGSVLGDVSTLELWNLFHETWDELERDGEFDRSDVLVTLFSADLPSGSVQKPAMNIFDIVHENPRIMCDRLIGKLFGVAASHAQLARFQQLWADATDGRGEAIQRFLSELRGQEFAHSRYVRVSSLENQALNWLISAAPTIRMALRNRQASKRPMLNQLELRFAFDATFDAWERR